VVEVIGEILLPSSLFAD